MKAWASDLQKAGFTNQEAIGEMAGQLAGTPEDKRADRLKRWCEDGKDEKKREEREKGAVAARKQRKEKKAAKEAGGS